MGKHADTTPRPIVASYLPGTGKRKAPATVDNKLSTHTGTASSVANTARTNIHN